MVHQIPSQHNSYHGRGNAGRGSPPSPRCYFLALRLLKGPASVSASLWEELSWLTWQTPDSRAELTALL